MTRSLRSPLLVACGLALLAPGASHASDRVDEQALKTQQCECRVFARMYSTRPWMRARVDRHLRQKGVAAPPRRRLKRTIYDYDRTGDFKERFCKRHPRVCRAAAKCILAAGVSLIFNGLDGRWSKADATAAAGACAAVAADVLVFR